MARARRGEAAALPLDVQVQLVAARYGQSPSSVRSWPADDFLQAVACLSITGAL